MKDLDLDLSDDGNVFGDLEKDVHGSGSEPEKEIKEVEDVEKKIDEEKAIEED